MQVLRPRRILTLAILFLTASLGHAQQTPPLAGIAHVAIRVRSLDAARDFYNKLGFEEAFTLNDKDGKVNESFIKINDHQFLELYPADPDNAKTASSASFTSASKATTSRPSTTTTSPTASRQRRSARPAPATFSSPSPAPSTPPVSPRTSSTPSTMPGSLHSDDQGKHLGDDRIADTIGTRRHRSAATLPPPATSTSTSSPSNPSRGDPMFLHMPGNSGQEIEIATATSLGTKARFTLHTLPSRKSARLLRTNKTST